MSVKSHLTSVASVCPENTVTYSAGNRGQKIGVVFSETIPLLRSSTPSVERQYVVLDIIQYVKFANFLQKMCMCVIVFAERTVGRELLLVMPPSKVCTQWHELMAPKVLYLSAFI